MATIVVMPRQGNTVESCLILEWTHKEGDVIAAGEKLCEVETDKATFDVEAPEGGTVLRILHDTGAEVPVLSPIAVIGEPGEEVTLDQTPPRDVESRDAGATGEAGRTPAIERQAPESLAPARGRIGISPVARRLAASAGLDIAGLAGTGPGGRIIKRDVLAALDSAGGTGESQPLSSVRRRIAQRMTASLRETAQLTLAASADARALRAVRSHYKKTAGADAPTVNDLLLFATSRALKLHREINAHCDGDTTTQYDYVHLGFAVDTDRGLLVPVIRNAGTKSPVAIATESRRLSTACLAGTVRPEELSGATFTVTNLGPLGVESFTPILNPPEVGILGVGAIRLQPIESVDEIRIVPHIGLSLTIDHRAVDGAPAARFLQTLSAIIAGIDRAIEKEEG
jgi:pyruvate dehydrogenase E2 component (dihydrolipoamide acetyltransferase)